MRIFGVGTAYQGDIASKRAVNDSGGKSGSRAVFTWSRMVIPTCHIGTRVGRDPTAGFHSSTTADG